MALMLTKMPISGFFTSCSFTTSMLMLTPGCEHGICTPFLNKEIDTYHPMIYTSMEWLPMDFAVLDLIIPVGLVAVRMQAQKM